MKEKTITHKGIEFIVNEEGGITYMEGRADEIFIPSVFPDGTRVTCLGFSFCHLYDICSKLVVDNEISIIVDGAFRNSDVLEVVWPSFCEKIPQSCFTGSSIQRIHNIDHVVEVGISAFADSGIEEIVWPSGCEVIPSNCFFGSTLRSITNIDHVRLVDVAAFGKTLLNEIVWPSKCKVIPIACFRESSLSSISNIENVISIGARAFKLCHIKSIVWPSKCNIITAECFACSKLKEISNIQNVLYIDNEAFYHTEHLKKLDLSGLAFLDIQRGAFAEVDRSVVDFPYYMPCSMFEDAFRR